MGVLGIGMSTPVCSVSGMLLCSQMYEINGCKSLAISAGLVFSRAEVIESRPGDLRGLNRLIIAFISLYDGVAMISSFFNGVLRKFWIVLSMFIVLDQLALVIFLPFRRSEKKLERLDERMSKRCCISFVWVQLDMVFSAVLRKF